MKIAILGWGSLIWDTRELKRQIKEDWKKKGPILPIEFSRISSDARLTLVIDPENGRHVQTQFVESSRKALDDAICDLRYREGTVLEHIGYVNLERKECRAKHCDVANKIKSWAETNKFDAVVWTDLSPNFLKQIMKDFSVQNAVEYLKNLPKSARKEARMYIRKAHDEVKTPLRNELQKNGWLNETS